MGGYLCPGYLSKDFCIISLLSAAQKLGTIFTFVNHIKHEWQCLMAGVTVAGDTETAENWEGDRKRGEQCWKLSNGRNHANIT